MTDHCWTTVGVQGDRSCADLVAHVHCRNCPVHHAGAVEVLDAELGEAAIAASTAAVAGPLEVRDRESTVAMVFRVAAEWLALPAGVVVEVVNPQPIHSLPHHRDGTLLGITNVGGELLPCISLGRVLQIDQGAGANGARTVPRFLVARAGGARMVLPADEVHGFHRFVQGETSDVPATLARARRRHTSSILAWERRAVALLDPTALVAAMKRVLA
jgi:chemotaxis-related protein WspD